MSQPNPQAEIHEQFQEEIDKATKTPKPPVIYSILKWYAIVVMTLGVATLFVEAMNGVEEMWVFLLSLPIPVYLWSLVVRKIT